MHILLLEASANDAAPLEALLRVEWPLCTITRAGSRLEFYDAIQASSFALILGDLVAPEFDGLAALAIARAACPETPFVFRSGTSGDERAITALKAGASDYVSNDLPGRLVPAIRLALARSEEERRVRLNEEAVRQDLERFRAIVENVSDMISMHDRVGRSIYRNPAYRQLFGDTGDQSGDEPFSRVHPGDRERIRTEFADIVQTGEKRRMEYRYRLPNGAVHDIESVGTVIRDRAGDGANVVVVSRDITERKRSEAQVRELAALVEKTQDAVYVRDLDHRITYWNSGAERVYGWRADEVLGRSAIELFYKEETPEMLEVRRTVLTTGEWSGELKQFTRTGREIVVLARRTLLRDSGGAPVSILNLNTDVTEQRQLQSHLMRNQRMESLGTLTGGIAHDLNNVLSPILMGAGMLGDAILDERSRRTLDAMSASARHGTALVRQLLTFASGSTGERTLVQPGVLLTDFGGLLRQGLPASVKLQIAPAPDCWPILADTTQLQQVLLNLCINARDAMTDGGQITVLTHNVVVDEALARRLPEGVPGAYLRISVSDTGAGIAPEVLDRIFEPFFTTKQAGKGTGLGLSTVRGIVKGHGGFLDVESALGRGSTFHVYIPMFRPAPSPATPAPSPEAVPSGQGETILVVDDDPGMRDLMQSLLDMKGYKTLLAFDGVEALRMFLEKPERVDALVTDMLMPVMNGASLIQAVRAVKPALPVLAITGVGDLGRRMPGFDQRVLSALISKPIDTAVLLVALRRALDRVP